MTQTLWIIIALVLVGGFVIAGVIIRFRQPAAPAVAAPVRTVASPSLILSDEEVISAGVQFHNLCRRAADQKLAIQMTQGQIEHNVGVFTGPYQQSPTPATPPASASAGG